MRLDDMTDSAPGPRPEEENLSNDQIIAKYGSDLKDSELREQIIQELVYSRKLTIAADRKAKKEFDADSAWVNAWTKYYGTDEG